MPQDGRKFMENEFLSIVRSSGGVSAWGDVTGTELDAAAMKAARTEEV